MISLPTLPFTLAADSVATHAGLTLYAQLATANTHVSTDTAVTMGYSQN
jgi:hypothetical protein